MLFEAWILEPFRKTKTKEVIKVKKEWPLSFNRLEVKIYEFLKRVFSDVFITNNNLLSCFERTKS